MLSSTKPYRHKKQTRRPIQAKRVLTILVTLFMFSMSVGVFAQWMNIRSARKALADPTSQNSSPNYSAASPSSEYIYAGNRLLATTTGGGVTPQISAAGTGCPDNYCIWVLANNFVASSNVVVRRNDGSGDIIETFSSETLVRYDTGFTIVITNQNTRNALNHGGIKIWLSNPDEGTSSNGVAVSRTPITPQITAAGTGCEDGNCLWIQANNFIATSFIDVRRNDGSGEIIDTIRGDALVRYDTGFTLRITNQNTLNALNSVGIRIWVVNPDEGTWSNGFTITR